MELERGHQRQDGQRDDHAKAQNWVVTHVHREKRRALSQRPKNKRWEGTTNFKRERNHLVDPSHSPTLGQVSE